MSNDNRWDEMLASNDPEAQVDALRKISGMESVTGVTICVVSLSISANEEVRMWAAEALESAVQPSPSDIPSLIEMLRTSDEGDACYWSATLLGRLGSDAIESVDALELCLRDSNYLPARERAAWALCQIGPPAAKATATLKRAAADSPPRLQRIATEALRAIGEAAA